MASRSSIILSKPLILSQTENPLEKIQTGGKKRPQLTLQVNFSNSAMKPGTNSQHKQQQSLSAQKNPNKNNFEFNEVLSAGLHDSSYDNYSIFRVFFDVSMKKCNRSYMEDRVFQEYNCFFQFCAVPNAKSSLGRESFFGVFDGHKTAEIADYLKTCFFPAIQQHSLYLLNLPKCIFEVSLELDSQIEELSRSRNIKGGSTALCSLVRNSTVYLFNVGDSLAALVSQDEIKFINEAHRPSNPKEQDLLESKGAFILQRGGTLRINGELAITRSFGDGFHKNVITAEPEITTFEIQPENKYLIMATDGFWDVMSLSDTYNLICQWENERFNQETIEKLSAFLIGQASQRVTNFKKDNMTLLAIDLQSLLSDNPRQFSRIQID